MQMMWLGSGSQVSGGTVARKQDQKKIQKVYRRLSTCRTNYSPPPTTARLPDYVIRNKAHDIYPLLILAGLVPQILVSQPARRAGTTSHRGPFQPSLPYSHNAFHKPMVTAQVGGYQYIKTLLEFTYQIRV